MFPHPDRREGVGGPQEAAGEAQEAGWYVTIQRQERPGEGRRGPPCGPGGYQQQQRREALEITTGSAGLQIIDRPRTTSAPALAAGIRTGAPVRPIWEALEMLEMLCYLPKIFIVKTKRS